MHENLWFSFGDKFNYKHIRRLREEMEDTQSSMIKNQKMCVLLWNGMKHDVYNIMRCFKTLNILDLHEIHLEDNEKKISTKIETLRIFLNHKTLTGVKS